MGDTRGESGERRETFYGRTRIMGLAKLSSGRPCLRRERGAKSRQLAGFEASWNLAALCAELRCLARPAAAFFARGVQDRSRTAEFGREGAAAAGADSSRPSRPAGSEGRRWILKNYRGCHLRRARARSNWTRGKQTNKQTISELAAQSQTGGRP